MAEIKIEKRKPIWPWIVAGLLILGIAIYFLADDGNRGSRDQQSAYGTERNDNDGRADSRIGKSERDQTDRNNNNGTVGLSQRNGDKMSDPAVQTYVSFVREDLKNEDFKENNAKVRQAFIHLTDATQSKAQQLGAQSDRINIAREHADQLSGTTANAENIRATAEILADELARIQQSNYPDLDKEVKNLREASADIKPEERPSEQGQEIKSFLTEAADLLENMEEEQFDNR